jgi:hypothetical protein
MLQLKIEEMAAIIDEMRASQSEIKKAMEIKMEEKTMEILEIRKKGDKKNQ